MSESNTCPFCNRVLVQKSDKSQLCMFCGWKSSAPVKKQVRKTDQNLKQPQEQKTGKLSDPAPARKKAAPQGKIATTAEDIARQQLQQENSRQQVTLVTVAVVVVLGLVTFQMCRPAPPSVEPEAAMTPAAQDSVLSPPPPASPVASPVASPSEQPGALVAQTPVPQASPTMDIPTGPAPTTAAPTGPAPTTAAPGQASITTSASPSESAAPESSAAQVSPPPVEATPTAGASPS